MSRFYARYVPPATKLQHSTIPKTEGPPEIKPIKRKSEDDLPSTTKRQKRRTAAAEAANADESDVKRQPSDSTGKSVLEKYRISEAETSHAPDGEADQETHELVTSKRKKAKKQDQQEGVAPMEDISHSTNKKKHRDKKSTLSEVPDLEGESEQQNQRHSAVLSKFEKARRQDRGEAGQAADQPVEVLHGLEPFPEPKQPEISPERPSYSVLPLWQERPLLVPAQSEVPFESLPLSETLLTNLKRRGLTQTLPVQSTVLPLLLDGSQRHWGDVCVSAATGSGKTLSYILPIIADLKDSPDTRLRAVIVVPTRELVKQVRELCEACGTGTPLVFATSVGSKSLAEEQEHLVVEEKIYDPVAYQRYQCSPVNWSTFSMTKFAQEKKNEDLLDTFNHVTRYESKVDVLITTPGRLVDHLRSTTGFTLDHVKWLVVDEADRLLNESYQEWLAVVKPALESSAATSERDELLKIMSMPVPQRKVTKILLSATMTRDLSKLYALGLRNPKLVVLSGSNPVGNNSLADAVPDTSVHVQNQNDSFHLPDTLGETVLPVPDGSEKPLYLMSLLTERIGQPRESRVLIFTRSTASAERLSRLLTLLDPDLAPRIGTLTRSTASSASSRRALASFNSSKMSILIATDRASRGLDVPGLEHVVSYDVPNSALTYVHRVGRTARANKHGHAWTLIEHREAAWFWREIGGRGGTSTTATTGQQHIVHRTDKVSKLNLVLQDTLKARYEEALSQLGEEARHR